MEIYYTKLPHCPDNQLAKSDEHRQPRSELDPNSTSNELIYTDAGYDLRTADNVMVYPPHPVVEEMVTFTEYWQVKPGFTGKLPDLCYEKPEQENYYIYHAPRSYSRHRYQLQLLRTGIQVQPSCYGLFDIRPRSSTHKLGLVIANSPGTVDYSYTGELLISVYALQYPIPIPRGTAIAQLVPLAQPITTLVLKETLEDRSRGSRGFGSTGT